MTDKFSEIVRFECNDVTSALVRAAEHADKIQGVVILCKGKDGEADWVFCDSAITSHQANWLADEFKAYLLRHINEGREG